MDLTEPTAATASATDDDPDTSLNARLSEAIGRAIEGPKSAKADFKKLIRQELSNFEASNELGSYTTKLLNALKTVQPTSTESERVFSSTSIFCSKRRSRLSDESLNALCLLKSFFLSKK